MTSLFRKPAQRRELRPHQVRAIDMLRSSIGKGNRRVVIQAPTGAGKTVIAATIINRALAKGNRVILTAPAVSLIDQTVEEFETEGIEHIGVMQANHPRTDKTAPVQVASVQTLRRRGIPQASLVIVDECHVQHKTINALMDERSDLFVVGLSATPWARGMGLRWQDLLIPATTAELIEAGRLSRFVCYGPDLPDLSCVKTVGGEYAREQLAEIMGEAKLVGNVVSNWLERGENRPTLCFCVNRAHAREVASQFERSGVSTAYVDGDTDRVEREVIGARFRHGEIAVIVSVRTMTTGVDLPVSCVIDAAPTKSEMLHVQKWGRGLRINPGTEDCVFFDHAGNAIRLGLPTDIHHETLDATKPGERRAVQPGAKSLPRPCVACGAIHTGLVCPACGRERRRVSKVQANEGVGLVQVSGKKKQITHEDKQRFWGMALYVDQSRGRGRKLALALYKGRFGVWPRGLVDLPVEPDQAFLNYEKSRRIAFAKRRVA